MSLRKTSLRMTRRQLSFESLEDRMVMTASAWGDAINPSGSTDAATHAAIDAGNDLVAYRLEVLNDAGNVTTSVAAGETFTLVAYVQDQRPEGSGVFAAFLDVDYVGNATVNGNIVPGAAFSNVQSGLNTIAGVLDEVGALSSVFVPTGNAEFEVFRQSFTAGQSAGTVEFTANEPEDQSQRATLVFGLNDAIPTSRIEFGATTLTITGGIADAGLSSEVDVRDEVDTDHEVEVRDETDERFDFNERDELKGAEEILIPDYVLSRFRTSPISETYPSIRLDPAAERLYFSSAASPSGESSIEVVPFEFADVEEEDETHQSVVEAVFADSSSVEQL